MKSSLGLPVYYRIDKFIHFSDFSPDVIFKIVMKELAAKQSEYQDKYSLENVYSVVSSQLSCKGENARTIKYKIQQAIEDMLFEDVSTLASESILNRKSENPQNT